MIDGKEAALEVRKHFETVHGVLAVANFTVINIKKIEDEKCWEISCRFYPGYGAREPLFYKVKIDSEDGKLIDQEMIVSED